MKVELVGLTKASVLSNEHEELSIGQFIAFVARVSNPANQLNTSTSERLLKYLVNNSHWSPFEMASLVVSIETTRDIAHQILRHRSFSFQEFSQRYAAVESEPVYRPARLQDTKNRQNSRETDNEAIQIWWHGMQKHIAHTAQRAYESALERGIAKEVARAVLPEGLTATTLYMAGSVRSWIHYCALRCTPGTQKEHREVALACREVLLSSIPELVEVIQ